MNNKSFFFIIACTVAGLIAGYAIFGKLAGDYVSMKTLFSFGGNVFQTTFRSLSSIEEMRKNILLCGAGGLVAGTLAAFLLKKK